MKILMVYDSLSPIGGGSQTAMLAWVENLKKLGIEVKILCNKNAFPFLSHISKENIITLNNVDLHWIFPHYYPTIRLSQKIKKEILAFGPDVIHVHEPGILVGRVLQFAKKQQIPTLINFQTDLAKQTVSQFPLSVIAGQKGLMQKWLVRNQNTQLRKADFMTVPTQTYKKMVEQTFSTTPFLLPLPIKKYFYTKSAFPIEKIPHNLLAVARLSGGKHIDTLLSMMQHLTKEFSLTIIGDGPDKAYLSNLAKKYFVEERVNFLGWVSQQSLPNHFQKADLFLSPSDSETFGITYIDALASRVPVVVYDYPVSREVIPEGMGVFVKSFDPKVWAGEVLQLQNNPKVYEALQKNIAKEYDKLRKYEETESTKKLIEVYKNLLRKSN